jgi:hypothetical protein
MPEDGSSFTEFNAVAAFSDPGATRAAVDELKRSGIDGARLSLAGDVATERLAEPGRRRRDAQIGRKARSGIPLLAVIGVLLGAALGAAIGGVMGFGLGGIVAFAVMGAVGIGTVGGVLGGIGSMRDSHPSESPVVAGVGERSIVGVHVDRREELEHALAILHSHHADAIDLLDREGNRTSAA